MVEVMELIKYGNSVKQRLKGSSSIQTEENTSQCNFVDLISALPDSLLLHILSFLYMEQVMKTSLLSRRWRYLWKSIPCLSFQPFVRRNIEFTNLIDRCLFHHEGSKIHKLHINFDYLEEHKHAFVDSWIHFAIRRKVEDFKLQLLGFGHEDEQMEFDEFYKLPCSLYFCETLTSLTLSGCNLNLPQSFKLGSLKKLSLELLELYSNSIEHLSSSCPLLEEIYIIDCNRSKDLNIVITNEYVKRLEFSRYGERGDNIVGNIVKINAPTLLSLVISDCCPCTSFDVEELGSLLSADIIGDEAFSIFYSFYYIDDDDDDDAYSAKSYVEGLLSDLRHVKRLKLCSWCLQILSVTKMLRERPLSISATCVELQTTLTKWELPGISYLLKSCSNLENLEMSCRQGKFYDTRVSDEFRSDYNFEKKGFWESVGIDFPSILQNIKIIKLNDYDCSYEAFVRFLLKNSKILERMVISSPKSYFKEFEKLFKLTQRLIVFPRSSPNAEVFIT